MVFMDRDEPTAHAESLRDLSDEELIQRFRRFKSEGSGNDPALVPPVDGVDDAVRQEMERRGLAPDREDIIPSADTEQAAVEDDA